jgi:hypothetical protein
MKKTFILVLSFMSILSLAGCRYSHNGFLSTSKLEEFGVSDIESYIPFESDYFYKSGPLLAEKDVYLNIVDDSDLYELANSFLNYFHDESKFTYCGYLDSINLFGSDGDAYISLDVEDYFWNSSRSVKEAFYIVFVYVPINTDKIYQLSISKADEVYSNKSYNAKMTFENSYNMTIWEHHKNEHSEYGTIIFENRKEFDEFYNGFLEYNDYLYFIPFNYEEYFPNFKCDFTCYDVYTPIIDEKRYDYEFIYPNFRIKMSKNSNVYYDQEAYLLEYTPYNIKGIVLPNEYNITYNHNGEDKYTLLINDIEIGYLEIKILSEINRTRVLNEFVKTLKITI